MSKQKKNNKFVITTKYICGHKEQRQAVRNLGETGSRTYKSRSKCEYCNSFEYKDYEDGYNVY